MSPLSKRLRQTLPVMLGLLAAVLLAALLLLWSGLVSVAASTGHWPMMDWLLHYAARRSVATHSIGIEVPDLSAAELLPMGARQYRAQCETCHGAPGSSPSLLMAYMTPPAPLMTDQVAEWEPQELFWIIKHGIKYTAMPAWVSSRRDDDIWPVVAFVQALPGMSAARYRQLTASEQPATEVLAQRLVTCASCHGDRGQGADGMPRLAGQSVEYLQASLDAYANGSRHSGVMQAIAADLSAELRAGLARHYGSLPKAQSPLPTTGPGFELAHTGNPAAGVPPCVSCHAVQGSTNPRYPDLQGQPFVFLQQQLHLFKARERGGSEYAPLMQTIAERLSEKEIEAAAGFYGLTAIQQPAIPSLKMP